jgi:tetratricopeptide (TPR) repeat protein
VRLYTGDLLPEDRYEDWAAGRREELESRHLELLLTLARLREARGDTAAAADALRRVVTQEPSHEEAHLRLMRLYAQTGQRHQALRQYQQLRETLRREWDVDPSPESQQLYQDILDGRMAPVASPRTDYAPAVAPGDDRFERGGTLVGRDAEIEAIEDLLDATFAGRGRLLLLTGEAGIGKSRLVAEIAERVRRRGGVALLGAAYEQEGRLPYGPFVEALAPLGGLAVPDGFQTWLGDNAHDIARLPTFALSALRADRQRLFATVADLLRKQSARTPTLLALDDLHAADDASLQLLHYLARTCRDVALLIVGTFRPEEVDADASLADLATALHRERLGVKLDLQRLSRPESDLFVTALLEGDPADRVVSESLYRLGAGNPLYTEEMLRALREAEQLRRVDGRWRLPDETRLPAGRVLDLLTGRVSQFGPAVMQVLSVAAVTGAEIDFPLLRAVSELSESELLDTLDVCLSRRLLVETPDGYRFDHPLRRMAMYERLSSARRMSLHGRVAAAVELLHVEAMHDHAEMLAHHWALSERPGQAVPYLIAAGDRAEAMYANVAAGIAYERALDLLSAPGAPSDRQRVAAELWEKVGDLKALAGDAPLDARAYEAALEALRALPAIEPVHLARLHRKIAYATLARHDYDSATPHIDAAEAALDDARESAEWARIRLLRSVDHWAHGRHDEGRRAAEESLKLARQHGEDIDVYNAYGTLALVFHSSGTWKTDLQFEIERSTAASDASPWVGQLFDIHSCLAEYYMYSVSSFDVVESYANGLLERAQRVGARRAEALAWLLRGQALLLRGRWDEASSCLMQSLSIQRSLDSAPGQVLALQRLAQVSANRGEHAAARQHLDTALAIDVHPPMAHHVWVRVHATAAFNALETNDLGSAVQAIESAEAAADHNGSCLVCGALLNPVATRTYVALGDLGRAEHYAEEAERTAQYWDSGTWWAMAKLAQAEIERLRGDTMSAEQRFLTAAAEFERVGQPFDAAWGFLRAGQAAADRHDTTRAQALIGRALSTFSVLGAITAIAQARQLLDGI